MKNVDEIIAENAKLIDQQHQTIKNAQIQLKQEKAEFEQQMANLKGEKRGRLLRMMVILMVGLVVAVISWYFGN